MPDQADIESLIKAERTCLTINTYEEGYILELVTTAAINLRKRLSTWTVDRGIFNGLVDDGQAVKDTANPAAALTYWKLQTEPSVLVALDLIGHLEDERCLRCLRELIEAIRKRGGTLVMIDYKSSLPPVIAAYATPFDVSLPDEKELDVIIRDELRKLNRGNPVEVKLNRLEYDTVIKNLSGLSRRQARRVIRDVVSADHRFTADDVSQVIAEKRRTLHADGLLEFVQTPADLSQVGGLARLKAWLSARRLALTSGGESFGLPAPRGVLLLGVQGAGKSLCAKAIATAWERPLLRMDPGALYDKFIGESERRLRDSLRQAETMAPIVLWIDEIEKGFASAGDRNNDGGLSQRMFGTLLTWMQERFRPVFLVATANNIEALPPELIRKGRFDEIFFVDLPGRNTRKEILSIHLKKRGRKPERFDLETLATAAEGYSGAEIEQAIVSALYEAYANKGDLTDAMIEGALKASPPLSVTMAEKVEALRQWAVGRCVPAE